MLLRFDIFPDLEETVDSIDLGNFGDAKRKKETLMAKKYKAPTKPSVFEKKVVLLPRVVAETVLMERGADPYAPEGQWFVEYVDKYVRWLHANKANWKKKLEKGRDPRPFVYGFVRHWLDSYEQNPRRFKTQAVSAGLGRAPLTVHHGREDWQVRYMDEDGDMNVAEFGTSRKARGFLRRMKYPWPVRAREVHDYGRKIGWDLIDDLNNIVASVRKYPHWEKSVIQLPSERGFGAGEETVDSIYLGNFGDVSPFDYYSFFVWWQPSLSARKKGKKSVKKLAKTRSFKSGDLFGITVTNWCDATGECDNEERVLAEELHVGVADLLRRDDWINWESVAESVGLDVPELLKDPVWAWDAAIHYYGAREFHPGGYQPLYAAGGEFVESFRRMALDLLNLGVPRGEIESYLEG